MTYLSEASATALELPPLLAVVAALAATDLGADAVRDLRPAADAAELALRQARLRETGILLGERALVPSFEEPIRPLLELFTRPGASLGGADLVRVAGLIGTAADAVRRVTEQGDALPGLAGLLAGVPDLRPLEREIRGALDRRGQVREDATPELASLRAQIRRERDGLYGELGGLVQRYRDTLSEETIPMRGGRLVLVLQAGARGRAPGLVHGRSSTGKSFYFEPLEVVEGNNRLQQAVEDEEAERRRIVADLVRAVTAALPDLERLAETVAALDLLQALSRFGDRCEGRLAEMSEDLELRLVGGRHPLLDASLADLRETALGQRGHEGTVVPLDLELDAGRRALVVTGPNAGGKTVALKTVGLLTLAAACGIPVPVAAGTRLPLLARIVATVGDEQDLLAARSTFSGRLLRLREAWEAAEGGRALVLLDELGSGTDPEEGAALAVTLLERLVAPGERGTSLAILTTHLTQLAAAAIDLDGASCAAMEFDPGNARPTYRLLPGPPGASEAIALARRLGLPEAWIGRAESRLGTEHLALRRMLVELETARSEVAALRGRLASELAAVDVERAGLERARAELEAERSTLAPRLRRELESFRRETTRRLQIEVDRLRDEVSAGRRRGLAEAATGRLFAAAPEVPTPEPARGPLVVGARVRHLTWGWTGTLERLDGDRAEVAVRGKRMRCAAGELAPDGAPEPSAAPVVASPEPGDSGPELHLIGQRVEEALLALDGFLDVAARNGRREVRVVHGHGSGRLRSAVREHLRKHPLVTGHRPGEPREGGNGATVATLRD